MICASSQHAPSCTQFKKDERSERGNKFPSQPFQETIIKSVRPSRAALGKNKELRLLDFVGYAGNDREVRRLAHATEVAERNMELVDPTEKRNFDPRHARNLYRYLFPNKDEAEDWNSAIAPRLHEMMKLASSPSLQRKYGDSRFHAIVSTNKGQVVGYTQFSTMPLEGGKVVVFWQYGGVADKRFMRQQYHRNANFREEGLATAFYVFRHGIADHDAKSMGYKGGVVGTICEAEFVGMGDNASDIKFTKTRLHIHRQMGARAMMLEMEDGSLVTAHIQPRLSLASNPILLHMLFRPLHFEQKDMYQTSEMDKGLARSLVMSYMDNFDREGFGTDDVQEARLILQGRFAKARRVLLVPPETLPNMIELARMDPLLKRQVENDYGSLERQEAKIKKALAELAEGNGATKRLGS